MPENVQYADVLFPRAGLDVSEEHQLQPGATAARAVNVRLFETLTGRGRGGSRPGLSKLVETVHTDADSPIQHLAVVLDTSRSALNKDDTVANGGWAGTSITDPSTNNQPLGRPPRNQRNPDTGGSTDPRVIRAGSGGSGRPHVRNAAPPVAPDPGGECVCRTYHVSGGFEESFLEFTICDNEEFPLDFTAEATLGWSGDPLVAPGPEAPTLAELLAIIEAAGGPPDVDQYDSVTDVPCEA
jgi:hypothetical protein